MKTNFLSIILIFIFHSVFSQTSKSFADSIRIKYNIPELAYAVVSADSIIELAALGEQKVNTNKKANINDKFRIGSNTKTITAFIATLLVKKNKLLWTTNFFDLFPELKSQSNPIYHPITLLDLLTMRAPLLSWTYTDEEPSVKEITGDTRQQRYHFISWVLKQKPVSKQAEIYWSNPAYVMVGLMLEKASGKSYETLVEEFGKSLNIQFGFGQPNYQDNNQPWGHNELGKPEQLHDNKKLNWLSSAGNINVSLPDHCKFIQLQLQGLSGLSNLLTKEEFEYLHYGFPLFAIGWKWYEDENTKKKYSYHDGNPGTFLSKTIICHQTKRAFIIFTNIQSSEAESGIKELMDKLKSRYTN